MIYSRLSENPHEWHSKGQEFDSPMLHKEPLIISGFFVFVTVFVTGKHVDIIDISGW